MQYELIKDASVGVIIDPTPILRDIKDTFCVSFILPEAGAYVALFGDESSIEYRATIQNGIVKVPKQILTKEQRVSLTVCQLDGDEIAHSWTCQPLKIGMFLSIRDSQRQITAGTDDRELYARFAEIERIQAKTQTQLAELQAEYAHREAEFSETVQEYAEKLGKALSLLASVQAENKRIAEAYNKAIEVVNNLCTRVYNLEKNYDPTLIK